jgi:hypothetical protein
VLRWKLKYPELSNHAALQSYNSKPKRQTNKGKDGSADSSTSWADKEAIKLVKDLFRERKKLAQNQLKEWSPGLKKRATLRYCQVAPKDWLQDYAKGNKDVQYFSRMLDMFSMDAFERRGDTQSNYSHNLDRIATEMVAYRLREEVYLPELMKNPVVDQLFEEVKMVIRTVPGLEKFTYFYSVKAPATAQSKSKRPRPRPIPKTRSLAGGEEEDRSVENRGGNVEEKANEDGDEAEDEAHQDAGRAEEEGVDEEERVDEGDAVNHDGEDGTRPMSNKAKGKQRALTQPENAGTSRNHSSSQEVQDSDDEVEILDHLYSGDTRYKHLLDEGTLSLRNKIESLVKHFSQPGGVAFVTTVGTTRTKGRKQWRVAPEVLRMAEGLYKVRINVYPHHRRSLTTSKTSVMTLLDTLLLKVTPHAVVRKPAKERAETVLKYVQKYPLQLAGVDVETYEHALKIGDKPGFNRFDNGEQMLMHRLPKWLTYR